MNRSFKLLVVTLVLAAGIGSAMHFRSHVSRNRARQADRYGQLEFRSGGSHAWGVSKAAGPTSDRRGPYRLETVRVPAGMGLTPDEPYADRAPPRLPSHYPSHSSSFVSGAWTPLFGKGNSVIADEDSPEDQPPTKRTHTIRDGDTLRKLAERYLGDAQRWRELYEANSARITNPELLPIGAILEIPSATQSSSTVEQTRLVPISRAAE